MRMLSDSSRLPQAVIVILLMLAAGCAEPPAEQRAKPVVQPAPSDEQRRAKFLEQYELKGLIALIEFGTVVGCDLSDAGLKHMAKLQQGNDVPGLAFVRVETSGNDEAVEEYYKAMPLKFPVHRDPGVALAMAFEATVYPTFVVVGKSGRVRYRGKCPDARLKDWVATLQAEKADPGPEVAMLGAVKLDATKLLAQTTLPDLAGNEKNLGSAMGAGGLLVMFVDTKCPFSAQAMKDMPAVTGKLLSMKINSVLINVCDPKNKVMAYFKKRNVGAQVIYDETPKTNDYWNVYSVPTVIFISPAKEIGYNGNALWANVAVGIEKVKGLKRGTISFKAKGTGYG